MHATSVCLRVTLQGSLTKQRGDAYQSVSHEAVSSHLAGAFVDAYTERIWPPRPLALATQLEKASAT